MKKTQTMTKTSFKGLVDLQSQKLPQKKSRSRSIRDRNNTTSNQFSLSRATDHQPSQTYQDTRIRQGTWGGTKTHENYHTQKNRKYSEEGIVKFDDNLSSNLSKDSENEGKSIGKNQSNIKKHKASSNNQSKNEGSMQKIRENMRKESEQIKQKIRQRSQSRRKNKHSNSQNSHNPYRQNSRQEIKGMQNIQNKQQEQRMKQKQAMNQIINLKNRLQGLQYHYGNFQRQLQEKQSLEESCNGSKFLSRQAIKEEQMKEKAHQLNNLVETFHITFKQNLARTQQQINKNIESYAKNKQRVQNESQEHANSARIEQNLAGPESMGPIFQKLQKQFFLKAPYANTNQLNLSDRSLPSSQSFLIFAKEDKRANFNDLEKRLLLAEERLLK